jgi:hypothetical protein
VILEITPMTAASKAFCPICLRFPQQLVAVKTFNTGGEEGLGVCSYACAQQWDAFGNDAVRGFRWLKEGRL